MGRTMADTNRATHRTSANGERSRPSQYNTETKITVPARLNATIVFGVIRFSSATRQIDAQLQTPVSALETGARNRVPETRGDRDELEKQQLCVQVRTRLSVARRHRRHPAPLQRGRQPLERVGRG